MSKPVPHHFYRDPSGRTYSRFSSYIPVDAELVDGGWTVQHPDGTRGLGRAPFASRDEAQAWCDAHPNFPGMSR